MVKKKLGEILIEQGKIDQAQLMSALGYQKKWGGKIGECLVRMQYIAEVELAKVLSEAFRMPLLDLSKLDSSKITKEILSKVKIKTVREYQIVPLSLREVKGRLRLILGTSDPTQFKIFDEIQFNCGLPIIVMVCTQSDIDWFIRKFYFHDDNAVSVNYVSGIEVKSDAGPEPDLMPIAEIFQNSEFTGMSRIGQPIRSQRKTES